MIPVEELGRLPLLRDEPAPVVEALARHAVEVRFPGDGILFLAGSEPRGWFVVLEGGVRVVRGGEGRQHVVHTESVGGTLGEVPLFAGGTHPATGIAVGPTRCALLDRGALEAAMREAPAIGFLLARRLALRVRALVDRLDDRSARSVRARLASWLVTRREATGRTVVTLGMTQRALAEELGTVREVVGRELRALVRQELVVARARGRWELLDIERLRALTDHG